MTVYTHGSEAKMQEQLARIWKQSGDVLRYDIIEVADVPDLVRLTEAGEPEANRMLGRIAQILDAITCAPSDKPVVCGTCDRSLKEASFALVWVHAEIDQTAPSLFIGICDHCGPDVPALQRRSLEAIEGIWPGAQRIVVHGEGGRA